MAIAWTLGGKRVGQLLGLCACLQACATAPSPKTAIAAPRAAADQQAGGLPAETLEGSDPGVADHPVPGESESDDLATRVVAAVDRSAEDRDKDGLRHPEELLKFAELASGMRVADLGAGSGYTTELLARAVGVDGRVFGQNNRYALERFVKESWPERLDKPIMANVVRVDSELTAPLPEQARDLDRITMLFYYHDAIAQDVDVAAMNRAIFAALKPGGIFVVADHHARPGSGTSDTKSLHRIEPGVVEGQVTAAGFEFVASADFLRDPSDTHDWKVYERAFQTDRFVLKFRKPQ